MLKKSLFTLTAALIAFACSNIEKNNTKVYQWRGDNRNGIYNEANLLKQWPENGPELKLAISGLGWGYTSPTITPEHIFIAGMIDSTGYQFCYTRTGELVWKTAFGKEWNKKQFKGARSCATVKGNELYSLSSNGLAYKMNAQTGEILWQIDFTEKYQAKPPHFGYSESPLLVDDKVIYTPGDSLNNIVCLNQADGSLVWSTIGEGYGDVSAYCSAQLIEHGGRRLVVQMTKHHLQGIDFDSGEKLWADSSYKNWTDNCNTPVYKDGKLLMMSPYGAGARLYQLSADGSAIDTVWTNPMLDPSIQSMVVLDGHIYSCSSSKRYYFCANIATGDTLWASRELKEGPMIYADGLLYAFANDGEMALIEPSPEKFNIISKHKAFSGKQLFTHPVIDNGELFVRANDTLKVYNISL